jgi:hypothetical protein
METRVPAEVVIQIATTFSQEVVMEAFAVASRTAQ